MGASIRADLRRIGFSCMEDVRRRDLFASHENLSGLTFDSIVSALRHLQVEAMKRGWEIGMNESKKSTYATFYCLKGGRQRGDKSNKTGCEWKLSMGPRDDGKVVVLKSHLQHNHELTPDKYSLFTLGEDKQDLVRKMAHCGIDPTHIQRFLYEIGEKEVTADQIRRLKGRDVSLGIPETEELANYMREVNGVFRRMETRQGDRIFVHAVFTAAPFELENLKKFGQVIWLDGTQRQNRLQWEIIPVTVIDQFKRIRSAGVFFVSRSDQEVIRWILEVLLNNKDLLQILRTIITDEDSAFIPAFDTVMRRLNKDRPDGNQITIHHVLCAFHKEQNYIRKLQKAGLTAVQRETAKDLFKIVCYSPHKKACEKALEDIIALSPKLASYVRKHVKPVLDKFARSHLGHVFTKGYNTTSPAESHNNMIKRAMIDGRRYSLKQMRIDITFAHRNAELSFRDKIASAFRSDHFSQTQGKMVLSPKIIRDIDATIAQAKELVWSKDGVFHPDCPDYAYRVVMGRDGPVCDCGKVSHAGLVCAHILLALKELGQDMINNFPFPLISPHWVIRAAEDVIIPVNKDGQIENDAEEGEEPTVTGDVFPDGNPLEDTTTTDQTFGERDVITFLTDKDRFQHQKERYLDLFHIGKTIASLGSRNLELSTRIRTDLQGMLNTLLQIPETTAGASQVPSEDEAEGDAESDRGDGDRDQTEGQEEERNLEVVEVHDCVQRRRGRPRKELTVAEMFHSYRTCILCGARHQITSCSQYEKFASAVAHNREEVDDQGRRRCGICCSIGHTRRKCPWLHTNNAK